MDVREPDINTDFGNKIGPESDADLQESFEFSRTMIENLPYPVLVTNLDSSVQYANPAFEKLTGFTSLELLGRKSPYPWWPAEKVPEYSAANAPGRSIELNKLERYYRKKNGEELWVVLHIAPVRYKGKIHWFVGNYLDFTERKKSEEALHESESRFRMLSENSLAGIFIVRDDRFRYVNPAFANMLGSPREQLIGADPRRWVHASDLDSANAATRSRLKGEQTHIPYTVRGVRNDGSLIWMEVLSTRFEDEGKPALFGTVLDVTEQRMAEQEIEHLRQIMAHVARVKTLGELATSLAHELNQPLTAILTNARAGFRMMNDGRVKINEIGKILEDIAADGQRGGEIIRRMREPLKRGNLKAELLNMNDLIQDIQTLVRKEAQLSGTTLELVELPGLPKVKGDRTQLQQVLLNLIVNALESVKDPACQQRWIEVRTLIDGDSRVKILVSDSGPGISKKARAHLFEPFYTTKPEGLGVGLSICRDIVEAHGGSLWEEDRQPQGATFVFTLPAEAKSLLDPQNP